MTRHRLCSLKGYSQPPSPALLGSTLSDVLWCIRTLWGNPTSQALPLQSLVLWIPPNQKYHHHLLLLPVTLVLENDHPRFWFNCSRNQRPCHWNHLQQTGTQRYQRSLKKQLYHTADYWIWKIMRLEGCNPDYFKVIDYWLPFPSCSKAVPMLATMTTMVWIPIKTEVGRLLGKSNSNCSFTWKVLRSQIILENCIFKKVISFTSHKLFEKFSSHYSHFVLLIIYHF